MRTLRTKKAAKPLSSAARRRARGPGGAPIPKRGLFPHQEAALRFLRGRGRNGAAVFMHMRFGKSLVALRWLLSQRPVPRRVLLVAPSMPLLDWEGELGAEEIEHVRANPRVLDWQLRRLNPRKWMLTTYETLRANRTLLRHGWDAVLLDESTAIKNPRGRTTRMVLRHLKRARLRVALSGMPAPQDLSELWTQMAFVGGGAWMGCTNFWSWRKTFFYEGAPHQWLPKDGGEPVRQALHRDAFVLRPGDPGAPAGLLPIVRRKLVGETHPEVLRRQREVLEKWRCGPATTQWSMVAAGWLEALAGGHLPVEDPRTEEPAELPCWKYGAVAGMLRDIFCGERLLVWTARRIEAVRAVRALHVDGVAAVAVTGETHPAGRADALARFRAGQLQVLVLTEAIGQMGLDLSCAAGMIYLSRNWSYGQRCQSAERCSHPNRREPAVSYDLICRGTIDETILEGLARRKNEVEWLLKRFRRTSEKGVGA